MSEDISDDAFLYNYLSNKFKETPNDPFKTAILKRRCMILTLAQSSKSLDNATSCNIFEDQLKEYCSLVDDRNGINNFAKATLDVMSNVKNVSKSWKSGLPTTCPIPNPLSPLRGECVNPTNDGYCDNGLPPLSLVHKLLSVPPLPEIIKPKVQTTLEKFTIASNSLDSREIKENGRKSLYSSYKQSSSESKTTQQEDYLQENNFESKGFKKSLYSSYSESRNAISKQKKNLSSKHNRQGSQPEEKKKIRSSLYSNYTEESNEEPSSMSRTYYQLHGGKAYSRACKPIFTCGAFNSNSSDNEEDQANAGVEKHFKTASRELLISNKKKYGIQNNSRSDCDIGQRGTERGSTFQPSVAVKKFLGGKRSVTSKFVPPMKNNSQEEDYRPKGNLDSDSETDERLKNIDPKMVELIQNEIMDSGSKVNWDDIAGLDFAKTTIQEIVVWPMLRPDIFTGLRRPPKGILLFGPPGTGKTLIGKCIASQSNSTFFSISASSLTSKWIGDGEKMVRALFAVARCHQPAVVFIDEIDSLLSQRSDTEHESSRRIKTEFLVQLDGAATGEDDRILIIGATNRPQELDEAARRRLVKRLYIPLPDKQARKQLIENLMKLERNDLTPNDVEEISCLTEGYSGADMKNLCQEASLGPIRSISSKDMYQISAEQVRPVNVNDFKIALRRVKSSVSSQDLEIYLKWDHQYGSGSFTA